SHVVLPVQPAALPQLATAMRWTREPLNPLRARGCGRRIQPMLHAPRSERVGTRGAPLAYQCHHSNTRQVYVMQLPACPQPASRDFSCRAASIAKSSDAMPIMFWLPITPNFSTDPFG